MYRSLRLRAPLAAALLLAGALLIPALSLGSAASAPAAEPVRTAYLTFDDGPSAVTPALLDALAELGVPATFFITGQNPDCFESCARAHAEGHLLAVHTYTHRFSDIYRSSDAFWADMERINDEIERITGARSTLLRFPGGSSNTAARRYGGSGIMRQLADECAARGYRYFDWNVDTGDALGDLSAATIARRAVSGAKEQQDAIILMHDGIGRVTAAAAVRLIVPQLLEAGYRFDTLDHLAAEVHHTLA